MKIRMSAESVALVKRWEGCPYRDIGGNRYAVPYIDIVGVPTIGYGFTSIDGMPVTMRTSAMTMQDVNKELIVQLKARLIAVARMTKVTLTPSQYGSLVSFAYNLGVSRLRASTLLKRINAEEWDDVAYQFSRWKFAGNRVRAGLVRRRKAEAELFMRDIQIH